jgi:protein gp37
MSSGSKIEWTDQTWNPVTGCSAVSEGCRNCYAARQTRWLAGMRPTKSKYGGLLNESANFNGKIKLHYDSLNEPLHWKKPRTVFVCSMSDLFHSAVPRDFVDCVWAMMAICPQHTFQVLTKRPGRMSEYLNAGDLGHRVYQQVSEWLDEGEEGILGRAWDRVHEQTATDTSGVIFDFCAWDLPLPNVWCGSSAENQEVLSGRGWPLLRSPAAVRFLSIEPLLGPD